MIHLYLYLFFLIGGAYTKEIYTTLAIYNGLLHFHNKYIHNDPLKKKGIKVAFTRKVDYNVHVITIHSTLRLPLHSANCSS